MPERNISLKNVAFIHNDNSDLNAACRAFIPIGAAEIADDRARAKKLRNHIERNVAREVAMPLPHAADWQVHDAAGRRKYLNADERQRFLSAADQFAAPVRALCYVLAFTGCRISEALALDQELIDSERMTLRFRTLKRRRLIFRDVPVPPALIAMLTALPRSSCGRFWPMHRATAWKHVQAVMDRAGIHGPMACCRGLRHAYGMNAAASSVPPGLIQRWLGHADLTTTLIYVDAVGVEERQFAERMWT